MAFQEGRLFIILNDFVNKLVAQSTIKKTCIYKFQNGRQCTGVSLQNGYCVKHQKSAVTMENIKQSAKKEKPITKTQKQIEEWLSTAIPSQTTVLTKTSKGFLNKDTGIIFTDKLEEGEYVAIGWLDSNGNVSELEHPQIEICEKFGWQYKC